MNLKTRLILMNFLQFAVWGAYLTSMGSYLVTIGMAPQIGLFYAMQGIVSLFMPALMGIVADRWIPAQKLLSLCHLASALAMAATGLYGMSQGASAQFGTLFALFSLGIGFYMPTLALSNSVAYNALERAGLDTIKAFPPIRTLGTVGFICAMWMTDLMGWQSNHNQFLFCAAIGVVFSGYCLTLPACPVSSGKGKSMSEALGLKAFGLFRQRKMALFFVFSMLLGVSLQVTNGFANPYISSFGQIAEYADTFGVKHANILISLSQVSETLCILLIPFCLKRFGIKRVMLMAMAAWVLRFGLFGTGDPGSGVWMFILSMIVYGVAFDFFNVSGSLFVDKEVSKDIRSSAQGLFVFMTNGFGATIGTLSAQAIVNRVVTSTDPLAQVGQWKECWLIFAAYALVVAVVFAIVFKYKHVRE